MNCSEDTVSLKEIKEAIQTKINKQQKTTLIKNICINAGIAMLMIIYAILIMMGSKNIEKAILEKDIKIITLSIVAIGIYMLEISYKKDSSKLAINALEVIVFAASNLTLIYVLILYFNNLINTIKYIGIGVLSYYILKSIAMTIKDVRKYKKDNSDIKEIIKK